ncbi:MAG: hypothetical protein WC796_05380 [Candidatus Pacearchaeota archaeon]|jgi:hypothetical protein
MIKKIAFVILVLFSIVGVFVSSTALHEYSHYRDFKGIAQEGQICALSIPTNLTLSTLTTTKAGYYQFKISPQDEQAYTDISKYTEIKAYSIDAIMMIVLFTSVAIIILKKDRS